jgi:hypothetical protein
MNKVLVFGDKALELVLAIFPSMLYVSYPSQGLTVCFFQDKTLWICTGESVFESLREDYILGSQVAICISWSLFPDPMVYMFIQDVRRLVPEAMIYNLKSPSLSKIRDVLAESSLYT